LLTMSPAAWCLLSQPLLSCERVDNRSPSCPRGPGGPNRYHACAVPGAPETHARDRLTGAREEGKTCSTLHHAIISRSLQSPSTAGGGHLAYALHAYATTGASYRILGSRSGILHAHPPLGIPRAARHTKCKRCTIPELASTHTPHFEWPSQCKVLCVHAMLAPMSIWCAMTEDAQAGV